jgi:hypothetical protein
MILNRNTLLGAAIASIASSGAQREKHSLDRRHRPFLALHWKSDLTFNRIDALLDDVNLEMQTPTVRLSPPVRSQHQSIDLCQHLFLHLRSISVSGCFGSYGCLQTLQRLQGDGSNNFGAVPELPFVNIRARE